MTLPRLPRVDLADHPVAVVVTGWVCLVLLMGAMLWMLLDDAL